jgi:DNA recombination protein RmuC
MITYFLIGLIVGGAVGFIFAWLIASRKSSQSIGQLQGELTGANVQRQFLTDQLQTREEKILELQKQFSDLQNESGKLNQQVADQRQAIEEQKLILSDAQTKLQDTFKALAGEALKSNNEQFLQIARQSMSHLMTETKGDLGKHKEEINSLVKPLQETLTSYQKYLLDMENSRKEAYGGLSKHLEELGKTQQTLQGETTRLANALTNPKVGGRWGELTLRRAAELAGMSEYCDFEEQKTSDGDESKLRPDMIVHLPGGQKIAVDSKLSYQSYLDAVSATDPAIKASLLREYSKAVRAHVQKLSAKGYWEQFKNESVDFVVLFLPGESFFAAAVMEDHQLIEDAMTSRVVLASPTNLVTLLRAVAFGWRQEKMAENAQKIQKLGQELFDRLVKFFEHLEEVQKNLNQAVTSYNKAIGSLDSRLLPSAKKFV